VQEDLNALIIPGCSLVFTFNFEAEAQGKLMDGSELSTRLRVADIVSTIGLKGHALGRPLKLEKDCYDIYAICGFAEGNPTKSAQDYIRRSSASSVGKRDRDFVRQALGRIAEYFRSENARGPNAVSRFYGLDDSKRIDSYQRVSNFLKNVQQH